MFYLPYIREIREKSQKIHKTRFFWENSASPSVITVHGYSVLSLNLKLILKLNGDFKVVQYKTPNL
jgi:hypothetical protein